MPLLAEPSIGSSSAIFSALSREIPLFHSKLDFVSADSIHEHALGFATDDDRSGSFQVETAVSV